MDGIIIINQETDPGEVLRKIIKDQGLTQQKIADRIHTDRRNVNQSLVKGLDIRCSTLVSIANAAGYEVILKKSEY